MKDKANSGAIAIPSLDDLRKLSPKELTAFIKDCHAENKRIEEDKNKKLIATGLAVLGICALTAATATLSLPLLLATGITAGLTVGYIKNKARDKIFDTTIAALAAQTYIENPDVVISLDKGGGFDQTLTIDFSKAGQAKDAPLLDVLRKEAEMGSKPKQGK